jgi:hypothetical protein
MNGIELPSLLECPLSGKSKCRLESPRHGRKDNAANGYFDKNGGSPHKYINMLLEQHRVHLFGTF